MKQIKQRVKDWGKIVVGTFENIKALIFLAKVN
ncbi:hypothetical protein UACE39S_01260 [Ureibacillus acetophenoni]